VSVCQSNERLKYISFVFTEHSFCSGTCQLHFIHLPATDTQYNKTNLYCTHGRLFSRIWGAC